MNGHVSRRRFLAEMRRLGVGASLAPIVWRLLEHDAQAASREPHAAEWWHAEDGAVRCDLCPRRELLVDGRYGACHARQNVGNRMVTHSYDQPCVLNVDPIEKNPALHFLPGTSALAMAHAGCNLKCLYCQNWQFSQRTAAETRNIKDFDRNRSLDQAARLQLRSLVFTYTEGTVSPEFVGEMAALARSRGLRLALCTCGFTNEEPFRKIVAPFDTVTITFKGATEDFYSKVCGAKLQPVLDTMVRVKAAGKWLEVATLVVPTLNDDIASLRMIANWIVRYLGPDTPWHIERFAPMYKLTDLPATPQKTMETARKIGLDAGLKFVYLSNIAPHEGNHTYCPRCRQAVIRRLGFKLLANTLQNGHCPRCRTALPGVWS